MGPALLPAGAMLSMLRWSLSFTARVREGGVSCRSKSSMGAKAASCLNASITNDPGGGQAAGQEGAEAAQRSVKQEGSSVCLQDTPAMPPQVSLEMLPTAAVESVTLDEVCGAVWQGGERRMRDCLDSCHKGHTWCMLESHSVSRWQQDWMHPRCPWWPSHRNERQCIIVLIEVLIPVGRPQLVHAAVTPCFTLAAGLPHPSRMLSRCSWGPSHRSEHL